MERICVVGCSGGGKTIFATLLADRLGLPYLELDSIYHQPGWSSLRRDEFRGRAEMFTGQPRWVVDGNYITEVGDITWGAADCVIWIDTSRLVAVSRVIRRTLRRLVLREELWNGNRETWRQVVSRDPERSIVVWAWRMHDKYLDRYTAAIGDARWSHIRFVRLRTRRDVRRFLRSELELQSQAESSTGARSS